MKEINNPNEWLKGKTIKHVDDSASNLQILYFEDGTKVIVEAIPLGHGLYGPVWYEIERQDQIFSKRKSAV